MLLVFLPFPWHSVYGVPLGEEKIVVCAASFAVLQVVLSLPDLLANIASSTAVDLLLIGQFSVIVCWVFVFEEYKFFVLRIQTCLVP